MKAIVLDRVYGAGSVDRVNEDAIVVVHGAVVVLDGATGVGANRLASFPSDAFWFVQAFARRLALGGMGHDGTRPAFASILAGCREEYRVLAGVDPREVPVEELPSAGVVAFVVERDALRVYRLGDCQCWWHDGTVRRVFPASALEALDRASVEAFQAVLDEGCSIAEGRRRIASLLQHNRSLMNTPEGYSVLSLDEDCLSLLERSEAISPDPFTDRFLLATDGFAAVSAYHGWDDGTLFERCEELGLEAVLALAREVERMDPTLRRHPRLKLSDDAAALLVAVDG